MYICIRVIWPLMKELIFEQHVVHQKLLNGTDNKKKDLQEAKEKWVNL